jgi:ceramide glucosyltransferase
MVHTLRFLSDLCVAGALIGCACTLAAGLIVLRLRDATATARLTTVHPAVTILKPLCGAEPELYDRLAAFCKQDYAGTLQLVCGVQAPSDPAIEVVRKLQAEFADVPIALQVDGQEHGSNRKLSNLINMLSLAKHDTLIMADSDIIVGPTYVAQAVAPLDEPSVGAATCLYHGVAAGSLPSRLAALAINTHFLPQVVMALRFGLAQPCFGSTIAIRCEALRRIGGLRPFADVLAEDFAIGKAVRAAGFSVAVAPMSIGHVCCDLGARATLARQLRVARTIRLIEPVGYIGTVVTHPFALAAIAWLLGAGGAGGLIVGALACRIVLCACVQHAFRLPSQPFRLLPLHDLLAFAIYLASFAGNVVTWRGCRYRVEHDGTMAQDGARSA